MTVDNKNTPAKPEVEKEVYFGDVLFQQVDGHCGFQTPAKAADNSLCERHELALGSVTDKELCREVQKLHEYLALPGNTYYDELLKAVLHRIRYLSGTVKRLELKEVFDNEHSTDNTGLGNALTTESLETMRGYLEDQLQGGTPDAPGIPVDLADWFKHMDKLGELVQVPKERSFLMERMKEHCKNNPLTLMVHPGGGLDPSIQEQLLKDDILAGNIPSIKRSKSDDDFDVPKAVEKILAMDFSRPRPYPAGSETINMTVEHASDIDDLTQPSDLEGQEYLVKVGALYAYVHPVDGLMVADNYLTTCRSCLLVLKEHASIRSKISVMLDRLFFFALGMDDINMGHLIHVLVEKYNLSGEGAFVILRAASIPNDNITLEQIGQRYDALFELVMAINPGYAKKPDTQSEAYKSYFRTAHTSCLEIPEKGENKDE